MTYFFRDLLCRGYGCKSLRSGSGFQTLGLKRLSRLPDSRSSTLPLSLHPISIPSPSSSLPSPLLSLSPPYALLCSFVKFRIFLLIDTKKVSVALNSEKKRKSKQSSKCKTLAYIFKVWPLKHVERGLSCKEMKNFLGEVLFVQKISIKGRGDCFKDVLPNLCLSKYALVPFN